MDDVTILEDSLDLFGDKERDERTINYGAVVISIAPKEGKACTLLADQLFSPSFVLAEMLERGDIPCTGKCWIELGAGSGLVSIVAATSEQPPSSVVLTDFPDSFILGNLEANVAANQGLFLTECNVKVEGYAWGSEVDHLLVGPASSGFDFVVMSDLLYFDKSHKALADSIELLLARTKEARVYVAAGKYTRQSVCQSFLQRGARVGLLWEEWVTSGPWGGTTVSGSYTVNDLQTRKNNSHLWIGRWHEFEAETAS